MVLAKIFFKSLETLTGLSSFVTLYYLKKLMGKQKSYHSLILKKKIINLTYMAMPSFQMQKNKYLYLKN